MINVTIKIARKNDPGPMFPEMVGKTVEGHLESIGILEGGMQSGKTSLVFNMKLPDGSYVMAQMSAGIAGLVAGAVRGAEERFKRPE